MYDYLIVGSGLYGAVFAHEATKKGKKCIVIDKRNHLGGNIYCTNIEGINVHKYGPHIFHTNDKSIWDYVNQFVEFNRFTYSPIAIFGNEVFNLPFNMNTFYQLWGVTTPSEAMEIINKQVKESGIINPKNLEEQAIFLVGRDIYEKLIKGYTEKQWGKKATELPPFIIKRLPIRFNFDNNYFNDKYQGIPIGGYNKIIERLLEGIDCELNVDYFDNRLKWDSLADKILYTGPIDQFYNYQFGNLEYRSLEFETEILELENFQGNAGVNYTSKEIPYTRIVEHKHFEFGTQSKTVITKEYSRNWKPGMEPYYPVNDDANNEKYNMYKKLNSLNSKFLFGGRLAEYKYYDMHQVIAAALTKTKNID
ncbi:MAG: UDP-galactopyranose mutase [Bacteroidota bacterium]|jgi:UDP-galactopyranose mutase